MNQSPIQFKAMVFVIDVWAVSAIITFLILKWKNIRPSANAGFLDFFWYWPHQVDHETRRYLKLFGRIGFGVMLAVLGCYWALSRAFSSLAVW